MAGAKLHGVCQSASALLITKGFLLNASLTKLDKPSPHWFLSVCLPLKDEKAFVRCWTLHAVYLPFRAFSACSRQGMNLRADLSGVERQKLCSMTEALRSQRWKKCKVYVVSNTLSHQRTRSVARLWKLQSHFLEILPSVCACVRVSRAFSLNLPTQSV